SIRDEDRLPVTTLLMQRIKNKDSHVRFDAIRKLVKYGLPRKELGAELTPLLLDAHSGVRYYACEALKPCASAEPKKYVPPQWASKSSGVSSAPSSLRGRPYFT